MSPQLKKRLRRALIFVTLLALSVPAAWLAAPALLVVDSGAQTADAVVVLGGEPWTRPQRAAEVYQEVKAEMLKSGNAEIGTREQGAGSVEQGNVQHSTLNAQRSAMEKKNETLKAEIGTGEQGNIQRSTPMNREQASNAQRSAINSPLVIVSGNGDCQDVRRQMEAREVPSGRIVTECDSKSTHENALFTVKLLRERHVTNAVIVTSWFHSRRALACFREAAPEITFSSRPTVRPVQKSWWPDKYERQRITQEYAKIVYYWVVYGVPPWL